MTQKQIPGKSNRRLLKKANRSFYTDQRLDRKLKEMGIAFEYLFEYNPNMVALLDRSGQFIRTNEAVTAILGYTNEELWCKRFTDYVPDEYVEEAKQRFLKLREGAPQTFVTAVLHKNGYRLDLNASVIPVRMDDQMNGYIAICEDITQRKRAEQRIWHMAYYDDLTGLPNRRLFREQLQKLIEESPDTERMLSVFFLDIDRFKVVNESLGHDYGDMLLLQAAERFTRCVGENDLIARTEGDEFVICFTTLESMDSVRNAANEVAAVLEEPFSIGQYPIHITASVGVAVYTPDLEDAGSLMKCADIALSRAKDIGRNNYQIYNSDMKLESMNRLTLANELRSALNENQFFLVYQPQMNIETGAVVGMEALLRWNHPEKGIVAPKEFITAAEENGLILPMGEWVLREACMRNKQWQEEGLSPVPVSVNLSMRQFLQPNLKERIAGLLQETGLAPDYLELEITESMTMDVDHASWLLMELKQLGVNISIDDFGTGYSSLSYLKKFPIDKLKIDRSFVRDILLDPNDAAIVTAIIAMTRHLNLKVIAEGVETCEQLEFLRHQRCDEIQGYWFSPPLEENRMRDVLAGKSKGED